MGISLKAARKKAGYSVSDVSRILKIRKQYIIDLEEEDYKNIPGQIYVEGYKKMYYEFLKIDCPDKKNTNVGRAKPFRKIKKIERSYVIYFSIFVLFFVISLYSLISS